MTTPMQERADAADAAIDTKALDRLQEATLKLPLTRADIDNPFLRGLYTPRVGERLDIEENGR